MSGNFVRVDSFLVKKRNLRIFRIAEYGSAVLLCTSEKIAARHVREIYIERLLAKKKSR